MLGMHFMNPVPLMTLVELIRGQATSRRVDGDGVASCARALGKTAVEAADYPGFIANRILMPMINEAVFALMEGVGTRRGDRHGDEARHEPPDGTADARRLHRPRRLPRDPRRAARRPRRSEVPPLSAAAPDGRGRPARTQDRPRLLRATPDVDGAAAVGAARAITQRGRDSTQRSPHAIARRLAVQNPAASSAARSAGTSRSADRK